MGSGKPLYGYRLDPISKRYNAFGPEALVIKHMFMYVSLGYTLHQTAEILNTLGARTRNGCVFTPDWILKHILDSRYKGNDLFETIVSPQIFNWVAKAIQSNCEQDNDATYNSKKMRKRSVYTDLFYVRNDEEGKPRLIKIMNGDLRQYIKLCQGEFITPENTQYYKPKKHSKT